MSIGIGHCMTLGELLDALTTLRMPAAPVRWDRERRHYYGRAGAYPGHFHSWRGDYSDLTLDKDPEPVTVQALIARAAIAIGTDFEGWKGGIYRASRETPVWAENNGDCDDIALVGVRKAKNGDVVLVTKKVKV